MRAGETKGHCCNFIAAEEARTTSALTREACYTENLIFFCIFQTNIIEVIHQPRETPTWISSAPKANDAAAHCFFFSVKHRTRTASELSFATYHTDAFLISISIETDLVLGSGNAIETDMGTEAEIYCMSTACKTTA